MWGYIATFVLTMLGPILAKLLALLGLSVVAFTGLDLLWSSVESQVDSYLGQLGDIYDMLTIIGAIQFIKIILAAGSASITYKVASGAFKSFRVGG